MNNNKKSTIYKIISVILLVSVMLTIFLLSHQNSEDSSKTSGFVTNLLTTLFGENVPEAIIRTFGHFSEFATLGFLSNNCIYAFKKEIKPIICIIFSWAYAWTDEIHQIFIPGRAFQISDLLVDLFGIIVGTIVICIPLFIIKNKNNKKCSQENS